MTSFEVERWWAENPMTYGTTHGAAMYGSHEFELGSPAFFERLDAEFYSWNRPLHGDRPFSRLFPYDDYEPGAQVLEVGCGLGTMAACWARAGAAVTAVDLNQVAVETTRRRFELAELPGTVLKADARALPFDDASFSYAWSWGVLHHSPEINRSFAEMMRVLRPEGGFGVMVYNRQSLLHWYATEYLEGFLHYERHFLDGLALTSRYGDGAAQEGNAHTWPMTRRELHKALAPYSSDLRIRVLGTDLDYVLSLMIPGLARLVPRALKKPWARRVGWSLWASGHRD